MKQRIPVLPIQRRQGRQQMQNVLANAPHLVKRQANVNSDMHGEIILLVIGNQ
jgi:hypothetical protein